MRAITTLLGCIGLLLAGCQEQRSELRTWRAADHDQAEATTKGVPQPAEAQPGIGESGKPERASEAVDSPRRAGGAMAQPAMRVWAQRCMGCHGQIGTGDGAQAAGMGVPDFSATSWQGSQSNEQIAKAILQGRGKMPGFPLEPTVVADLVALIRQMGARAPATDDSVTATTPTPKNRP